MNRSLMAIIIILVASLVCSPVAYCERINGNFGSDANAYGEDETVFSKYDESNVGCTDNDQCGQFSYCAKEQGDYYGTGQCEARPEVCPDLYEPVCGQDGETYSNECVANSEGVNIAKEGECETTGCSEDADCGEDSFCKKQDGACNGGGQCEARPEMCPQVYAPVCGCDGETYSNECEANGAGVSIAKEGECKTNR